MSQPSAETAFCMSSTESALFGFDHFLPISNAPLQGISICTAGGHPSVHIVCLSSSCTVDSFLAPVFSCSILRIQVFATYDQKILTFEERVLREGPCVGSKSPGRIVLKDALCMRVAGTCWKSAIQPSIVHANQPSQQCKSFGTVKGKSGESERNSRA